MSEHAGPLLGERDGLRVIDCKPCGFAHLDPPPNADALDRFYSSSFWTHEKPGALAQMEERREWWAATHGDWLELVEQYAPGRKLLDVGAGFGHFMRAAAERGWTAHGVEPSAEAVRHASADVFHGTWERLETPVRYSCLSALWLIEHLPDPMRFLRWAHGRLVDGGVLLVVVPNDFTPIQRHLSTSGKVAVPWWFIHHTHTLYLTPVTLANLLGRGGFRIVERTTTYPMENFLVNGKDYTADGALGAELHGRVEAQDLNTARADRIEFYRMLARRDEGREIVFVAVRE